MRKTLVSRSPLLILVLVILSVAAILLPHDIGTSTVNADCPENTICDGSSSKTVKHTGFPYVWQTKTSTDTASTTQVTNKKLAIDIATWTGVILLIGLFPLKSEIG